MALVPIKLNGRRVGPHKATRSPALGSRTVLTNSPWEYVALWLQRTGNDAAGFYWRQAHAFSAAAQSLPVTSAPLLHYYTFLNAAKTLLSAKRTPLVEAHGLKGHNMSGLTDTTVDLDNEGVRVLNRGVFVSLAQHLHDEETVQDRSMRDLLFNLPCIHRTFCITYPGQQDMFIPVMECQYVVDDASMRAYLTGKISADFDASGYLDKLPPTFELDPNCGPRAFRSIDDVTLSGVIPTQDDIALISQLNDRLRCDLHYLAGSQTLWYIKAMVPGANRLKRSPLTATLAAMHRLSELSRYKPMRLNLFFEGGENWLLNEFIRMSPPQFIDEVTAQITGEQCMTPNVRPAT